MTQAQALDILKLGHNVYLTGSAGSGKTYVLNQYIDYLRKAGVEVAITASTGIAATHMNGMTIHAWSGLGIRDRLDETVISELEERKYLWDRFEKTKVLIIDEVSMLHHFRLDLVDKLARSFKRNSAQPFGGLQVILCGDFFQLPPVSRAGEDPAYFVYHSEAWRDLKPTICYLHEQHRQTDKAFLGILNDIRANLISEETYEHLKTRYNRDPEVGEVESDESAGKGGARKVIEPTRLYTHNADVDAINERELNKLPGDREVYEMTSHGRTALVDTLKKSCLSPEKLVLKVGARVMFVKNNYEAGYVNGTLGRVVGFDMMAPVVETVSGKRIVANPVSWTVEEEGKVKAEIAQVPLRLAWAITVHKSQGMSLDAVEVDLSKSFEKGMGYVALSRVRTLAGLKLLGINEMALQVHSEVLEFDQELQAASDVAAEKLDDLIEKKGLGATDGPIGSLRERQARFLVSISPAAGAAQKISTYEETKALLLQSLSLKEMAKKREMTVGTILSHLETLVADGKIDPEQHLGYLKPASDRFRKMQQAFEHVLGETGEMKLSPVRDIVGKSFNFEELRLGRLFVGRGE